MGTRLYVGNLPFATLGPELEQIFSEAGAVTGTEIVQDKFTGKSRGFGFVEMSDQSGADKAIELFNGKEVDGRALVVNEARPKLDRPPRERQSFRDQGNRP
ncbi:MAG: RNA-binding protein [Verrucomicrobiota bacterium]|nr:RNA-binding protein [Verrucomicrobiota bacterium]